MILTLEVTGPEASALGAGRRKTFGLEGGTIGRLPDNDWVLSDPFVSGRHAIVRFVDGTFHIEDTSRNGVFLNASGERLERGRLHALESGDRLFIDPYHIDVHVTGARQDASVSSPYPAMDPFSDPEPLQGPPPLGDLEPLPYDPLSGLPPKIESPPAWKSGQFDDHPHGGSEIEAYYSPPAIEPPPAPAESIPENWWDSGVVAAPAPAAPPPAPSPVPTPSPSPAPPASSVARAPARPASAGAASRAAAVPDAGLAGVFEAAGLADVSSLPPELADKLGRILRIVVSGVMDVLKARQQTKDQFRLPATTFKPVDNNPLKLSADVDHALRNLFLSKDKTTYLEPVEAFEDAFDDMRNHQIAMLVGVRVAFEAMLSEFHPDHLQEQFDRQLKKGALVSMPAKLRYWELYRDWIHDMVRDADTSFRELFGDEFARAYEEQLRRLKAQRPPRRR